MEWKHVKDAIIDVQQTVVGLVNPVKKQKWMTDNILGTMEKRRLAKGNESEYKQLNRLVRKQCREAKEEYWSLKCAEIEELQQKYDSFNLHKKIKEVAGRDRRLGVGTLHDEDGKIIIGLEEKLGRWHSYIGQLFNDDRSPVPPIEFSNRNEEGPPITAEEVKHAILKQHNGKAAGPDEVHAEFFKLIAEQDGEGLQKLTQIFNTFYDTSRIPDDWLKSTFIALSKKPNSSYCDDHRIISLMSHALKTFLRIIHTRIYKRCEEKPCLPFVPYFKDAVI